MRSSGRSDGPSGNGWLLRVALVSPGPRVLADALSGGIAAAPAIRMPIAPADIVEALLLEIMALSVRHQGDGTMTASWPQLCRTRSTGGTSLRPTQMTKAATAQIATAMPAT